MALVSPLLPGWAMFAVSVTSAGFGILHASLMKELHHYHEYYTTLSEPVGLRLD